MVVVIEGPLFRLGQDVQRRNHVGEEVVSCEERVLAASVSASVSLLWTR